MNIGYIGDRSVRAIIERSNMTCGITEDTEAVLVEDSLMATPPDLPCINSSFGIRNIGTNDELIRNFNEIHNIVGGYPVTYLYGYVGSSGFSELIEMTHSTRFLTGDIGMQIGFVQGTAVKCTEDYAYAIPDLRELVDTLVSLEYRGEIKVGITADYKICSCQFGHDTGGFALYNELSIHSVQDNYEWCLDHGVGGKLHENGIAIITLLSYPPYPYSTQTRFSIRAEVGAESHLYRVQEGACELAYVAAWGRDIFEAKRRIRTTIDKCRAYDRDIQHRVDFGWKDNFILSADRYVTFGGSPKHPLPAS